MNGNSDDDDVDVGYGSEDDYHYSDYGSEEGSDSPPNLPALETGKSSVTMDMDDSPPLSPYLEHGYSEQGFSQGGRGLEVCTHDVAQLNENVQGVQAAYWNAANSLVLTIAMEANRFLLDEERATAWGLEPSMPIVFQLEMDSNYTQAVAHAKFMATFQTSEEICPMKRHFDQQVGFGLAWVLHDRLQEYIRESWPGCLLRGEKTACHSNSVKEIVECCCVDEELAQFALQEHKNNSMEAMNALFDDGTRAKLLAKFESQKLQKETGSSEVSDTRQRAASDDAIATLMDLKPDLGVGAAKAILAQCEGDVARAAEILLDGTKASLKVESSEVKMEEPPSLPSLNRERSSAIVSAMQDCRNQELPYCSENYLMSIVHFVEDKMRTVNLRCLICDDELEYKGLTPVVCPKELCIHGYEQYSLGVDLESKIINHPEVTDLLISMLVASCNGGRIELNYPDQVRAGENMSFLTANNGHDFNRLRNVLQLIPSVAELKEWAEMGQCRANMDALHPLMYPLLRWVMASNRSHIRLLSPEERIPGLQCADQFLLMTGPLEREVKFQTLKEETRRKRTHYNSFDKTGSIFAFHGSGLGNWHSIMRIGLKNMSNTKYMSAGAAYGSGIYFADDIGTSLGYSGRSNSGMWNKSRYNAPGGSANFMALCEIIDRPNEFTYAGNRSSTHGHSRGIHVVPNEDLVMTRYFLVNVDSSSRNNASALSIPIQGKKEKAKRRK